MKALNMDRPTLVQLALERANRGWHRNFHDVPHGVQTWDEQYGRYGVAYVADGRKETGFTRKGRGTTAADNARTVKTGGIERTDVLSVKTDKIEKGNFPSKIEVSTGNPDTVMALAQALESGSSLPTVIFASGENPDGTPSEEGYALFLDLGDLVRTEGITAPVVGGHGKGKAPGVYFKYGSRRNCGATSRINRQAIKLYGRPQEPGKWNARENWEFPCIDERGRRWTSPWWVHYRQLIVNINKKYLSTRGLKWVPCHVDQLADLIDSQQWGDMGTFW